jgi:hypothetical protein
VGQCNISHPAPPPQPTHLVRSNSRVTGPPASRSLRSEAHHGPRISARRDSRTFDTADTPIPTPSRAATPLLFETDGADLDDGEDVIGTGNIMYMKGMQEVPLEARIERLFYINLYGQVSRARGNATANAVHRRSTRRRTTTFSRPSTSVMCSSTRAGRCGHRFSPASRSGCSRQV